VYKLETSIDSKIASLPIVVFSIKLMILNKGLCLSALPFSATHVSH